MKRRGQGLAEYTLVIALLALVSVAALSTMGDEVIGSIYRAIVTSLSDAENSINSSAPSSGEPPPTGEDPSPET